MIDSTKLTALIAPLQRVMVLCPRRCGKTAFLANYIDSQTCATVFLGLCRDACREMQAHLNRDVPCIVSSMRHQPLVSRADLLVIDEGLFMYDRTLFTLFGQQRIVVLSSQSIDTEHQLSRFAAAGFVTIDAPLQ